MIRPIFIGEFGAWLKVTNHSRPRIRGLPLTQRPSGLQVSPLLFHLMVNSLLCFRKRPTCKCPSTELASLYRKPNNPPLTQIPSFNLYRSWLIINLLCEHRQRCGWLMGQLLLFSVRRKVSSVTFLSITATMHRGTAQPGQGQESCRIRI